MSLARSSGLLFSRKRGSRGVTFASSLLLLDPRFRGDDKEECGDDKEECGDDNEECGDDKEECGDDGDDAECFLLFFVLCFLTAGFFFL